jgi:hypothetical protein
MKTLTINRAPVLTLWAAVVAERLGFDEDEALSLGKAVAGLNAQAKGRRLGIFRPKEVKERAARAEKPGEEFRVEICGRPVPVRKTPDGIRAFRGSTAIDPEGVDRYLDSKFGDALPQVRAAMQRLAKSYRPQELEEESFTLYERFRPEIPSCVKGWGAPGALDVAGISKLAKKKS